MRTSDLVSYPVTSVSLWVKKAHTAVRAISDFTALLKPVYSCTVGITYANQVISFLPCNQSLTLGKESRYSSIHHPSSRQRITASTIEVIYNDTNREINLEWKSII